MSAAFTNPVDWEKGSQDLAGANEIVLAYSERRQTLGASAISELVAGDNAQDKTLWLAMQNWLEEECTHFIDYVNGPLNSGETDFLYFTKATWQAAAGLNVSAVDGESFRRRINTEDADSYGHITTGDCRGPWVFEDLQKGFLPLKWTKGLTNMLSRDATIELSQHNYARAPNLQTYFIPYSAALIAVTDGFNASFSYDADIYPFAQGGCWDYDPRFQLAAARGRCYYKFQSNVNVALLNCELWTHAKATPYSSNTFDSNGDPAVQGFSRSTLETGALSALAGIDMGWFGSLSLPNIPTSGSHDGEWRGYEVDGVRLLMKWDFTNS